MAFRLPLESKKKKNNFIRQFLLALTFLIIGPFIFFVFSGIFQTKNNSSLVIQEFYLNRNNDVPQLYFKIRNDVSRMKKGYAELFMEDQVNSIKKQVSLGDLGEFFTGEEKEFIVSWEEQWQGSGVGKIRLVVHDEEGIVSEKSFSLAVVPNNIASWGVVATFLASGLLGVGIFLSKLA